MIGTIYEVLDVLRPGIEIIVVINDVQVAGGENNRSLKEELYKYRDYGVDHIEVNKKSVYIEVYPNT